MIELAPMSYVAVDVEQTVAAAVDDRQATVLPGDEDSTGELASGRTVGSCDAAQRHDRVAVDPLDPPTLQTGEVAGLVAVVDVDQVTDQEASSRPVDSAERDPEGRLGADTARCEQTVTSSRCAAPLTSTWASVA